jgi:hypothetical protein
MTSEKNINPEALTFTADELKMINNALNEVCNGIAFEDDEFQSRLGYQRPHMEKLLAKVAKALGKKR